MGRNRRSMEFIENRKGRLVSFRNRYAGLQKKGKELSTLCGIKFCMVVYGPLPQEVHIWSSDPDIIIQDLFNNYRAQPAEENRKRNVGVLEKMAETKLESLHRKNNEAKFPDWHATFDSFLETDLTVEANTFNNMIEYMKMKRDSIMEDLGVLNTSYGSLSQNQNQNDQHQNYYPQPLAMIIPQGYPPQPLAIVRPDPMMPIIDYNFQPFGGDYYWNIFPDHQLNNDQMDPLTIRGPPSSAQYFNDQQELDYTPLFTYDSAPTIDPPELDYTPSVTYSQIDSAPQYFNDLLPELDYTPLLTYPDQIDSAPTIDPALPQSFYGTDMDSSQLVHPYYYFQVNNY